MIQCGFEFEFGHDANIDLIKQIIKFHYPNNKIYTLTDEGVEKIKSKHYFIFKKDYSVSLLKCKNKSTELVTPVFTGKKQILLNFKKIFNILQCLNVKTNYTCSIHINIGFSEKEETEKINLGKLILYIDERKYLKLFNRLNNMYCKPCIPFKYYKRMLKRDNNTIINNFNRIMLLAGYNHHNCIALDKCSEDYDFSIIEFRFIGNDYINKFDDVNNTLNHCINGLLFSINKLNKQSINGVIKNFKVLYGEREINE